MNGRIVNMTWGDYHAHEALRASDLKTIALESLADYAHKQIHPRKSTSALDVGQAAHCAALEPEKFDSQFVEYEDRRAGKKYEAFKEQHPGKTILKTVEMIVAKETAGAVLRHPFAGPLVADGQAEVSILWEPRPGRLAKSRIDKMNDFLIDLKTTTSAKPDSFKYSAEKYGYFLQMAFYQDAVLAATGRKLPVKIIAVEKSAPYHVTVFNVPDELLQYGRKQYTDALDLLEWAELTGDWPGPYDHQEFTLEKPETKEGAIND